MYKGLYDQFKHWFHDGKGQVYFYSDPHFADEEMKHLRAHYIGDEEQVKRINSKIGKYDTLVILGDIGDVDWVKKIRGYKVLVMGNHDAGATNYQRKNQMIRSYDGLDYPISDDEDDIRLPWNKDIKAGIIDNVYFDSQHSPFISGWKDNHLFDEVYEGALIVSEKIILSHEPIDFPYGLNIHGHDHSMWSKLDNMHWNVCAEHINYTPICLKHIIESGRLKNIPTIHRETIDEATARKHKKSCK